MSNVKNFTIKNKNAEDQWEVLYPKTVASQVVTDDTKKFVSTEQITNWDNKATKDVATITTPGLMSVEDKIALDALSGDLEGIETQLKAYADQKVAELVDSAPDTLNTLAELATAIQDHNDEYDALLAVVGSKSTKEYVDAELAKKVNTAELTTTLATKANIEDVNTALEGKATVEQLSTGLSAKASTEEMNSALGLKVDVTTLDTELAKKANTTDVTTALEGKADAQATTAALATKAEKEYVDVELAKKAIASDVTAALATKADAQTTTEALATKATLMEVETAVTTAVATLTSTSVGTTAPTSSKPGDFWFEVTA